MRVNNGKYYGTLPTNLFMVRIPIVATYTEEEAMIYGLPADTEGTKTNVNAYQEMTNAMINVNKMIELYSIGYPINIVNPKDSIEVFNILDRYLNTHVNKIQRSINQPLEKDERLEEIDRFLTEMFDFNRHTIAKSMIKPSNGYDLGIQLMATGPTQRTGVTEQQPHKPGRSMGITAGYNNPVGSIDAPVEEVTSNSIYRQPNQVNVDLSKVNRRSVLKPGRTIPDNF